MKKNIITIPLLVLAALIAAFAAGVAGDLLSRIYISRVPIFSDLYLNSSNNGNRDVVIQEAKKVIVEQDIRVHQVFDKSATSVYGIYRHKSSPKGLDAYYTAVDLIGYALAVTSDGWLVTVSKNPINSASVDVVRSGEVYSPVLAVADPRSSVTFLKVEASDLPVTELAQREAVFSGQTLIAFDPYNKSVRITELLNDNYSGIENKIDLVRSLESVNNRLLVSNAFPEQYKGMPVFNLNGEVAGISEGGAGAYKISYVNFLLKGLLKDGKIRSPYLGLRYLDLSSLSGGLLPDSAKGILIVKDQFGISVAKDSPLFGLIKEGDRIVAVDGVDISPTNTLEDLLYDYKMDSSVTFKVLRGKEELEVRYTLAEKK